MFNTGSAPKLDSPPLDTVTAWRRGEVVLDNTTLNDAVAEMNRYEDHKLVIGSSEIGNLRISGIYHIGDSSGFARTVAKIYRLRMDEAQNKIYLNGKPSTD
jgi:transmembrane sensor